MLSIVIALFLAQQPAPIVLTAKSANVSDAGTPVKINLLRWSTEEERNPIVIALDPAAQAAAQAAGRGGRGGRGARAARGLDPDDPALADTDATPAPPRGGGRGGRGGGGRGGRGGDAAAPAVDPMTILSAAIEKAPTVGYLWTNETVGYSIKYAYKTSLPDGSERIILATDRQLGSGTAGWKSKATSTDYPFTLIEIRIDPKGLGEGKASLTSKVILDKDAKTVALENYTAAPAIFQNVKH